MFDGYYDETVCFHNPSYFIPNLTNPDLLHLIRQMEIVLVVGQDDIFLKNNRQLSQALWDKETWHAFHIWQGEAHKPREWRQMVSTYL